MITRLGLGAVGALVGLYGVYLLLQQGWDNLVATAIWLAGGVVLHDGVIGPAMVVAGVAVLVVVPERVRGPVAAGLIVLGTVTVTGIPAMTRFGERADNPTLLDRNYTVGWFVLLAVVVVATGVAVALRLRHAAPEDDVVREPHDEQDA